MNKSFLKQYFLVSSSLLSHWEAADADQKSLYFRFLEWLFEKTQFDIYCLERDNGIILFGIYGVERASYRLGSVSIEKDRVRVRLRNRLYKGILSPEEMAGEGGIAAGLTGEHFDYSLTSANFDSIIQLIQRAMPRFKDKLADDAERVLPLAAELGEDWVPDRVGRKSTVLFGGEIDVIAKLRVGQQGFRKALLKRWRGCAVTGVTDERLLVASHIKPWSQSEPRQKVDVDNGLLLTPSLDYAFDAYLITFSDKGKIIIDPSAAAALAELGIKASMKIRMPLNEGQKSYLADHRKEFERMTQQI